MLLHDRISNLLDVIGGFWEKGMSLTGKAGGEIDGDDRMQTAPEVPGEEEWRAEVDKVLSELVTLKVEGG